MKSRSRIRVEEHAAAHLGEPLSSIEMELSPRPGKKITELGVSCFASGEGSNVVFATAGAYGCRMSDGRRVEAVMMLKEAPNEAMTEAVSTLLASFVLLSERRTLRYGDVVRAPALLRKVKTEMDAMVVLPPMPFAASFQRTSLIEGEVEWLWLVPLFRGEAKLALTEGAAELVLRLAKEGIDLTDLRRRPRIPRRRNVRVSRPELSAAAAL